MQDLLEDIRHAVRAFVRQPGFSVAAVLLLTMGIASSAVVFTLVDSVLLKPLPYRDPQRLYYAWNRNPARERPQAAFAPAEFVEYRARATGFSHFSAYLYYTLTLSGADGAAAQPERVNAQYVSAGYFEMLGVSPRPGRDFAASEFSSGHDRVVLLTEKYWRRHYGGDPTLIGRNLRLSGELYTVAGIVPSFADSAVDLFLPLSFSPDALAARGSRYLYVLARLRDGESAAPAEAQLQSISAALERSQPDSNAGWSAYLRPAEKEELGAAERPLLVLSLAVSVVLLVACANLANLLAVRSTARRRELAVRSAMGASQARVFRQLAVELLVLAAGAGSAGLLLAAWLVKLVVAWGPLALPRLSTASVGWHTLAFTAAVALFSALTAGAAPSLAALRLNLADALREDSRSGSGSARRSLSRSLLVVGEVSLSVVLLVAAGLLLRTFIALSRLDMGFQPRNVLTLRTTLPESAYATPASRAVYVRQVVERLQAVPGVVAAGVTTSLPMMQVNWLAQFRIPGRTASRGDAETATYNAVSPGYFDAIGAHLRRGRSFNWVDQAGSASVVVVSQAFARRYFPHDDPLGHSVELTVGRFSATAQIAGVVDDIAHLTPAEPPRVAIYQCLSQRSWPFLAFAVRTAGPPEELSSAVRLALLDVNAELPAERVMRLSEMVDNTLAERRLALGLLSVFSGLAVVLAVLGLYGVLAVAVAQRTTEMGIRMALGARPADVLGLVLRQGLGLSAAGLAGGLLTAPLAVRAMRQMLYGVEPLDPLTLAAVSGLILLAAFAACLVPARRASRVDPCVALRGE